MRIGVIVAMDKEMSLLLPMLERHEVKESLGFYFHEGMVGCHEVVAMVCGIGKVNAAISTITLLNNYKLDLVINTGVAGGADKSISVMDVVVADSIAYHDVWCGPGTEYGQASGMPTYFKPDETVIGLLDDLEDIKRGLICSGDKLSTAWRVWKRLKSTIQRHSLLTWNRLLLRMYVRKWVFRCFACV